MKALVLGCGEMGEVAVRDLHSQGELDAIRVATRDPARARAALGDLAGPPAAEVKLGSEARRIDKALDDVLIALRGDTVMRRRNEPTPISISDRVEAIVTSHWSATVAPTGTSRQAYVAASDAFDKQLAALRGLVASDLRALEDAMEKAGAPWTPGRVPAWTKE